MEKLENKSTRRGQSREGHQVADARDTNDAFCYTTAEAAKYLHVATKTIQRYEKKGMKTAEVNGKRVYVKAILEQTKENSGHKIDTVRARGEEADAGYREIKRDLAKFELDLKQGELLRKADVENKSKTQILVVKRSHQGFSREVIPEMKHLFRDEKCIPEAQAIIDNKLRRIDDGYAKGLTG